MNELVKQIALDAAGLMILWKTLVSVSWGEETQSVKANPCPSSVPSSEDED